MANVLSPDFLVEIGTEELPPKALLTLMNAFAATLDRLLTEARIEHGAVRGLASPRRLAVIVRALAGAQDDREVDAKGPPIAVAFDDRGNAKPAALAFAKKCGVPVTELGRSKTPKGEWLSYQSIQGGLSTESLLPSIVEKALQALPVPRRMRWGASSVEFVRPVHWVLMLHGKTLVPGTVLGCKSGRITRGHRFLSSGDIDICDAGAYAPVLESQGFVLVDFAARQEKIVHDVGIAAAAAGGTVAADESLYEEVTALTEWPVVMTGHFDAAFLELPKEVIVASLTGHQRYFPISDSSGKLLPVFIVVTNLDSTAPAKVREGNERVIRSRLADAVFFWRNDCTLELGERRESLGRVVYQRGLGSLLDRSARIEALCAVLSGALGQPTDSSTRAAHLAKCDLLTGMVGEFPGLQGVMGAYYAASSGEAEDVATAIGEQYLPKFAGDAIPATVSGQILALADKLDALAGIFALGKRPTGNKDPFGLRRAALGVVRILLEGQLELVLDQAISAAVELQPVSGLDNTELARDLQRFVMDRLRSFYADGSADSAVAFEAVAAVLAEGEMVLADFDQRMRAVAAFTQMPESASLASANKRISNILHKSAVKPSADIDTSLFTDAAEIDLYAALQLALNDIVPLQQRREYAAVLARLAVLKTPVDRFFEDVLVMAEQENVMRNRLALLSQLLAPFRSVADVSRLFVTNSKG